MAIGRAWVLLVLCVGVVGCAPRPQPVGHWMVRGELGRARVAVSEQLTEDRADRMYLLDRMRLGILTLADGYPHAAGRVFEQVYEVLRTQGINADKTVASVVLNEDIKFWKGEPFEQAMALFYYSVQQAALGHWDNARAAAGNSLFRLRDFSAHQAVRRIDAHAVARRALMYERAQAHGGASPGGTPQAGAPASPTANSGYAVRQSDFTLGYVMSGLANQQLGRADEAADHFAVATQLDPRLKPLCELLASGRYNTVLVVGFGLGPAKVGYGPDRALSAFEPRFDSDDRLLRVAIDGRSVGGFPVVCDLNTMAANHMWNSLEGLRVGKSHLGTALLIGSQVVYQVGRRHGVRGRRVTSRAARRAAVGMALGGLFLKAGAHVDTRYCDAIPQRVYVVPIDWRGTGSVLRLEVEGLGVSRLVLVGLGVPPRGNTQLRYVHLVGGGPGGGLDRPPGWAVSGRVYYGNDQTGPASDQPMPYILGGLCVRQPSDAGLRSYQQAGYLKGWTVAQLREAYRAKGIRLTVEDQMGQAGLHLLEGGGSMVLPLAGTTGFARLMGQSHWPYRPASGAVKQPFDSHKHAY